MAEVMANHLGRGRLHAFSAGSHPNGAVNPFAIDALQRAGMPTAGLRSKSWDEFAATGAPPIDLVFTVCDNAANEACPIFPGKPTAAHWGVPDPASVQGTDEKKRAAFRDAMTTLRRRIELLVDLPLDKLDAISMGKNLRDIGKR